MDGRVDPPFEQSGVDFLGEEALAARLGEGPVLNHVPGRLDDGERDRRFVPALRRRQQPARLPRLRQSEGRTARAEGEKNLSGHDAPLREKRRAG